MATTNRDNAQYDPELFLILTPVSATIASQTVIDNTLNVKLYGFAVNNTTGSAATLSITDGDGNKILTSASFTGAQAQFVPTEPGYYMKNGVKLSSDTDNALIVWLVLRKM